MKWLGNRSLPTLIIAATVMLAMMLILSLQFNTSPPKPASHSPATVVKIAYYIDSSSGQQSRSEQNPSSSLDLFAEMARSENWQVEPIPCNLQECIQLLQNNEIDLLTDVIYSSERDQSLDFHTLPIAETWSQLYAPIFSGIRFWEDLANKRIAILNGSIQETLFPNIMAEHGVAYIPVSASNINELFLLVKNGEADAAVSDYFYGQQYAKQLDLGATPITFNQAPFYYATANGENEQLLKTIDKYLSVWQADANSPYFRVLKDTLSHQDNSVTPRWAIITFSVLLVAVGILLAVVTALRLRMKQGREQFQASLHRFEFLANSNDAVVFTIRNGEFIPEWISDNAEKVLGFSAGDLMGVKKWDSLILPQDSDAATSIRAKLTTDSTISHQFRVRDADGNIRHIREEMRWFPLTKKSQEIVGIWLDVTASHLQEEKVRYLVNFDTLTGLPNRSLLQTHLQEKIELTRQGTEYFLLVCLNIDRFININESFSSSVGDLVLVELVERLENILPKSTFIARTGADEFYFILEKVNTKAKSDLVVDIPLEEISKPIKTQETSLRLSISIGVCECDAEDIAVDRLILRAELAMAEAKRCGGNQIKYYEDALGDSVSKRFQIENALRYPIDFTHFKLLYQPQIDLITQQLVGVEALLYWQHPQLGLLPPAEFIPIAEETSSIEHIDEWVLNTACHQLAKWDSQGLTVPKLAINVSARECTSQALVDRIQSIVAQAIIKPSRLWLEITESMVVDNPAQTKEVFTQLHALGVGIAMDDFGTAYANFAQLGQLPIDCLKIDKTFVQLIESSANNQSIVRAIITLAKELQLEVIAEGVESLAQVSFLIAEGCTVAQGYLLGRPIEAEQLLASQQNTCFWEKSY